MITLNDYRPLALTSVVMKVFERLVLKHLKSITTCRFDPLQFAYRENRSVDDAVMLVFFLLIVVLLLIPLSLRNLKKKKNIIQSLDLPLSICYWILDFLLNQSQAAKIKRSCPRLFS